jgi:AraC-like DNA-binding protein
MPVAQSLPVVRACVFEPFLLAAREIGVPLEKALRSARLPTGLATVEEIYATDILLPEPQCWRFLQDVSRAEGLETYGLMSGMTIEMPELRSLAPLLGGCTGLHQLLTYFCNTTPRLSNSVDYRLEVRDDPVWFLNRGGRLLDDDVHAQLFQVLGMIQLVQRAAGPDWRPEEIHFTFPRMTAVADAPELNPARIRFSRRFPAISFSRDLLSRTLQPIDGVAGAAAPVLGSLGQQLSEVLFPYIGEADIGKETAAEIFGMSSRTLQRRLLMEATSYRDVVDRTRLRKARMMLENTDIKFLDIALSLGYEEAASFTRAFRRWTGVTPSEYRKGLVAVS